MVKLSPAFVRMSLRCAGVMSNAMLNAQLSTMSSLGTSASHGNASMSSKVVFARFNCGCWPSLDDDDAMVSLLVS